MHVPTTMIITPEVILNAIKKPIIPFPTNNIE